MSLTDAHLRAARARIAGVATPTTIPAELGAIRLRADQRRTAARVAAAIIRDGGCLLADDVGRGKTYVALAIARGWARPLAIVPAALRTTWAGAMRRADVSCALVTHESLSRGRAPAIEPDGIIVDESHRFRNPGTRRHAVLAALAAHTPLLLLSATPLQNDARDLAAQLALYLGTHAFGLDAGEQARYVVRGAEMADDTLPLVEPPRWVRPTTDDGAVLRAILSLPPPARPLDGGDAGVLRTMGLVRAWASSRAALTAMLQRRRHAATAIEQSAAAGLRPTKREMGVWLGVEADVQLGFAPLLVEATLGGVTGADLLAVLAAERQAVESLVRMLRDRPDPDESRIDVLRSIRAAHPNARILAFSELASTVRAYHAGMRGDAAVGMLTTHEARIASGRLSRDALLALFAPRAQGAREPPLRERVSLLLTTDLLSEGVNLQDASVVVHLDLPWNPARLAQRVGRVRRPGGAPRVHTYLLAPPADAELLLDVESRLRRKIERAERTIGRALRVVPSLAPSAMAAASERDVTSAAALGELADRLARWRHTSSRAPRVPSRPIVAAAIAERQGWLAALDDGRLIASFDGGAASTALVPVSAALLEGAGRPLRRGEATAALGEAQRWLDAEQLAQRCGLSTNPNNFASSLERGIAAALRDAPRHARGKTIVLAQRLRVALQLPRSLGAERELAPLMLRRHAPADEQWLERAVEIAEHVAAGRGSFTVTPRIVALVVLGPAHGDTSGLLPTA